MSKSHTEGTFVYGQAGQVGAVYFGAEPSQFNTMDNIYGQKLKFDIRTGMSISDVYGCSAWAIGVDAGKDFKIGYGSQQHVKVKLENKEGETRLVGSYKLESDSNQKTYAAIGMNCIVQFEDLIAKDGMPVETGAMRLSGDVPLATVIENDKAKVKKTQSHTDLIVSPKELYNKLASSVVTEAGLNNDPEPVDEGLIMTIKNVAVNSSSVKFIILSLPFFTHLRTENKSVDDTASVTTACSISVDGGEETPLSGIMGTAGYFMATEYILATVLAAPLSAAFVVLPVQEGSISFAEESTLVLKCSAVQVGASMRKIIADIPYDVYAPTSSNLASVAFASDIATGVSGMSFYHFHMRNSAVSTTINVVAIAVFASILGLFF